MNDKEKEQWLYETYKYTSNFDFSRLNKYEEADDDIGIDDLILDYTMLYELYKEKDKEIERLNHEADTYMKIATARQKRINKAIKYLNHLSVIPNVFGNYAIDGNCRQWLLAILRGDKK